MMLLAKQAEGSSETRQIMNQLGRSANIRFTALENTLVGVDKKVSVVDKKVSDMGEDVSEVKEQVSGVNDKVSKVDKKVAEVGEDVSEVKEQVSELEKRIESSNSSPFGNTDAEKVIFSLLPIMFDGLSGYCAWIPVDFLERDGEGRVVKDAEGKDVVKAKLVVISIPMVDYFVAQSYRYQQFKGEAKRVVSGKMEHYFKSQPSEEDFCSIMLRTPFNVYSLGTGTKTFSRTSNNNQYQIVGMEWFKEFLTKIDQKWPDRPKTYDSEFNGKLPTNCMTHRYSTEVGKKSIKYNNMRGRVLTQDELRRLPPCGVRWWTDLYEGAVSEFFGIPDEEGFRHVRNGVYDENGPVVKSYEYILRKLVKFSNNDGDSESSDDGSKRAKKKAKKARSKR